MSDSTVSAELRMAHDIARQFADEPVAEAAERIGAHVRKFWAPPMIESLVAEINQGAEADPAVAEAARSLGTPDTAAS